MLRIFFQLWNANRCQVFTTFPTPLLEISIICNVAIQLEQDRKKLKSTGCSANACNIKGSIFAGTKGTFQFLQVGLPSL